MNLLIAKFTGIYFRLIHLFQWLPSRLIRLGLHTWQGAFFDQYSWWPAAEKPKLIIRIGFWIIELILLILDALGLSELYETLCDLIKFNTRPLTANEIGAARLVFSNEIEYGSVRVDERALLGPSWGRFAYVGGMTINSWGSMTDTHFIHEITHVWQYQKFGLVYITRALWGQFSNHGYDYGGPAKIEASLANGSFITDFNYEQQAEIIADYFRMHKNLRPRYHKGVVGNKLSYESLIASALLRTTEGGLDARKNDPSAGKLV